jgi:hypothetical protein
MEIDLALKTVELEQSRQGCFVEIFLVPSRDGQSDPGPAGAKIFFFDWDRDQKFFLNRTGTKMFFWTGTVTKIFLTGTGTKICF